MTKAKYDMSKIQHDLWYIKLYAASTTTNIIFVTDRTGIRLDENLLVYSF